jgi:aminoglycoside/choline kinase family phosphotransferase
LKSTASTNADLPDPKRLNLWIFIASEGTLISVLPQATVDFINEFFKKEPFKVLSLAGDASTRKYFRLVDGKAQSFVLMLWEPFTKADYPLLSVHEHFQKNFVQVPVVFAYSESLGLVVFEDLGDLTLERKFWESQDPEASIEFYKKSLDELLKIHFRCTFDRTECVAFKTKFDTNKFLWEFNYGYKHLFENVLKVKIKDSVKKDLEKIFLDCAQKLQEHSKWITHRDYHSRNLMLKFDELRVIDFQDARLGPLVYDLVSLLRDSYTDIPPQMETTLLKYYFDQAQEKTTLNAEEFLYLYELQTIQRCFKAVGSFSSFFHDREDRRYLKYIKPTLVRVVKSLSQFPEYSLFKEVLEESGALETQFDSL